MNIKHAFLFFIFTILLSSCVQPKPTQTQISAPKAPQIAPNQKLESFSKLVVEGDIDIELHKSKQHSLEFGVAADALSHVESHIANDTLYLRISPDYRAVLMQPIKVKISLPHLHELRGKGKIHIKNQQFESKLLNLQLNHDGEIHLAGRLGVQTINLGGSGKTVLHDVTSRKLNINIQENARLELRGTVNLQHLNLAGQGKIDLYWIDSPELHIHAKNRAQAHLAGIVGTLHITVENNALVDARYLRAREVFLKATGNSSSEINAIKVQNILADDSSTVYTHNNSALLNHFMAKHGAVLDVDKRT